MKKYSIIEQTLLDAVCTETAGPMEPIHCCCGGPPSASLDGVQYGQILGQTLVVGCNGEGSGCQAALRIGNLLWGSRHPTARFLRAFNRRLVEDAAQLIDTLPEALGQS